MSLWMAILIHLLLLVDKADSKKGEMQFVISMACKKLILDGSAPSCCRCILREKLLSIVQLSQVVQEFNLLAVYLL